MAVTFVAAGAGAADDGTPVSINVPYPAGLADDDLLIAQIMSRNTSSTIGTPPAGWTLLFGPDTGASIFRQWLYYKISDGTETGTENWTISGAALFMGRMYAFRGAKTTTFTEGGGVNNGSDDSIECPSVTTTGTDELAVAFVAVADDNALGDFTGESGGNYTEAVAEFTSTLGLDGSIGLQTAAMASAGTVSGGTYTMAASDAWICRAFALKLAGVGVPDAPVLTAGDALGKVVLVWSTPADGGSAITGYNIYRGTSPGGEEFITSVGVVNTYDDPLGPGEIYYYEVTAVNANGEGERSNEDSAIPWGFGNAHNMCGYTDELGALEPFLYALETLPPNTDIYRAERFTIDFLDNPPSWGTASIVGTTNSEGVLLISASTSITEPDDEEVTTPLSHWPMLHGYFTTADIDDDTPADLYTQIAAEGSTSPVYITVPVLSADPGDGEVELTWTESTTCDALSVVAYDIFVSSSSSFNSPASPDVTVIDTGTYTIPAPNGVLRYYLVTARLGVGLDSGDAFWDDAFSSNPGGAALSSGTRQPSNVVSATPEGSALSVALNVRVPLHAPPA